MILIYLLFCDWVISVSDETIDAKPSIRRDIHMRRIIKSMKSFSHKNAGALETRKVKRNSCKFELKRRVGNRGFMINPISKVNGEIRSNSVE